MAEDHGAPEAGQLPRAGLEVIERERVTTEQVPQRVGSWTVQNEMRDEFGWITAGSA